MGVGVFFFFFNDTATTEIYTLSLHDALPIFQFGRRNEMGNPVTMLEWMRDHAVTVEKAGKMMPEELEDKFTIGILADEEKPIYTEEYDKIRERARD